MFLNIINDRYEYVYINPGNVIHTDYVQERDRIDMSTHMKSYVDFYTIANAEKVFLAKIPPLYNSTFPSIAALLYNRGCGEILYRDGIFIIN